MSVFIASAIVNCFLYAQILFALTHGDVLESSDSSKPETKRVYNQVARTLIINGVGFFICQIPYRLLDHGQKATVTTIGKAFLFLNSVINPFIYVFCSKHYQLRIKEALGYKDIPVKANTNCTVLRVVKWVALIRFTFGMCHY